jgi:hypothetical protein
MLTSYLIIVVSVPVVGFIPALKHGAFSLTLRKGFSCYAEDGALP